VTDDETYPFAPEDRLPVDATEEQVAAFEETVVRLLDSWIQYHGGSVYGLRGVLLSVSLDGEGPTRRLRFHYRSHAEGEFDAYWQLWGDQGLSDPPMAAGRPNLECPASLGSIISANWGDGSIYADEDPFVRAVRRQERAIADWRAAHPEAAAASPLWRVNVTDEEQRAEWADWAQRFPEAAARRAEVWRPVRDFVESEGG
jgi:hypothetical protein